MSDSNRVGRRGQPWWPSATRSVAAMITAAVLALLAAACTSSGGTHVAQLGTTATQSSRNPSTSTGSDGEYVSFARCMRSYGLTDFPDPVTGSGGHLGFRLRGGSNSDLNSNNPVFRSGVAACERVLGHRFRFVFAPSGVGKGA